MTDTTALPQVDTPVDRRPLDRESIDQLIGLVDQFEAWSSTLVDVERNAIRCAFGENPTFRFGGVLLARETDLKARELAEGASKWLVAYVRHQLQCVTLELRALGYEPTFTPPKKEPRT